MYRFVLFLKDNLGDCFKENVRKSLYMFLPAVFHIVMAVWISYTESYREQRAVIFLLLNFSLANSILDLMLVNMAKKQFRLLQLTYLYVMTPVLSKFLFAPKNELIAT